MAKCSATYDDAIKDDAAAVLAGQDDAKCRDVEK